ncbi:MAG: hypothetical protein JOZ07_04230 [Solirubrobacterales bacterium]|nr:hypothetical protein [Solirubrobacterales bacterium]
MAPTLHVQPTAPLAERVLLPGDPARALALAQSLLHQPKMFNLTRGLWGYSGDAIVDGKPMTIQSTGMGGPSAAIVITELAQLGARTMVRVGTCGALDPTLALGDLLVVSAALADDGCSRALAARTRVAPDRALAAGTRVAPDPSLTAALARAGTAREVTVVSTDLFYDAPAGAEQAWRDQGAAAVEMEAATLFALAARRSLVAGAALIVTDLLAHDRRRIEPDALREAELALGGLAAAALAGR